MWAYIFYSTMSNFDSYLPVHHTHTTFMVLRFVLRPFVLRIRTVKRSSGRNFLSPKILIVFDFVVSKSG